MSNYRRVFISLGAAAMICCASVPHGYAQDQSEAALPGLSAAPLELTAAQRSAIYHAVSGDKSKAAKRQFPAVVGAEVPPMIELYSLPDDAVAGNPAAKYYQYTMVQDQVVLVDPTKMRVIGVIGPTGR
jgi:hypothetical protein